MRPCECHRNEVSGPLPMLEGEPELNETISNIVEYLEDAGDDYLIVRLDQIRNLVEWAISRCRECLDPAEWFGYSNEGSIIHLCNTHRATASPGYTWVRIGRRLGFDN